MLWIDKHQPRTLDTLQCHPELTTLLKRVTAAHNFPHLLFYGPSGGGKKTRIMAVLRELYGPGIDKVKAESISPEGTNAEFVTCSSAYHNQISAPELGYRDRICVQLLIKQLAAQTGASSFSFSTSNIPKFRVFVIQEADSLSVEAQAGLRRTLEKYVRNARVILHCEQLSAILPPLRSRCLCVRVPLPSKEELLEVLVSVSKREQLPVSQEYLSCVVDKSGCNTRRALLMLENAAILRFPNVDRVAAVPWELVCSEIIAQVRKEQSPKSLLQCREKLYDVLTSCIPGSLIISTLCTVLLRDSPDAIKLDIVRAAGHYSTTMKIGAKDIMHLEAFLAQVMCFIKTHSSTL